MKFKVGLDCHSHTMQVTNQKKLEEAKRTTMKSSYWDMQPRSLTSGNKSRILLRPINQQRIAPKQDLIELKILNGSGGNQVLEVVPASRKMRTGITNKC